MRISDWSSDVCSSDLRALELEDESEHGCDRDEQFLGNHAARARGEINGAGQLRIFEHRNAGGARELADRQRDVAAQIGRAPCRERVCQYVSISVVAVALKKKKQKTVDSQDNIT